MADYVTKEIFLNSLECPLRGWKMFYEKSADSGGEPSAGEQFRMEQGKEIGCRARGLFPAGKLITEKKMEKAENATKKAISGRRTGVIFEGAFTFGIFAARADILVSSGGGWKMIEVKSGVYKSGEDQDDSGAGKYEAYIQDALYTAAVISSAGINLTGIELMLLSKEYRLGMEDDKLFKTIDITQEILSQMENCKTAFDFLTPVLTNKDCRPEEKFLFACKNCDYFEKCSGKGLQDTIFDFPRLRQLSFDKLFKEGYKTIPEIPESYFFDKNKKYSVNHIKTWLSVKNRKPIAFNKINEQLGAVEWPIYYLDFETIATALPIYPGTAPFEQIVTQYSLHWQNKSNGKLYHTDFLANDPLKDCRIDFIKKLIGDLGEKGSIIVYSHFEKTQLKKLIEKFPEYSAPIEAIIARLVDLCQIITENYYHPDFHGSFSIKVTLPALVKGMSYSHLNIHNGDEAIVAFARLAKGQATVGEISKVRNDLLEYCKQDTLAMVELHKKLCKELAAGSVTFYDSAASECFGK